MRDWAIEENLDYDDGVISDKRGRRAVIEVLSLFPALQEKAEEIQGPSAGRVLYLAEKQNAEKATYTLIINSLVAKILRTIPQGRKILAKKAAQITTDEGYGVLTIDQYPGRDEKGVLTCKNSFEADYRKPTDRPVCYFLAGAIAGAASIIFGKDFTVNETACEAMGDERCVFEAGPTEHL